MSRVKRLFVRPEKNPDQNDRRQNNTQGDTGHQLAAQDPPPIPQGHIPNGHGADDQRRGLGPGIAAAREDQRQKKPEHGCLFEFVFEITHCRGGEHFADEQNRKPAGAFSDHRQHGDFQIGSIERFHTAHLLDVFGRLLLRDIEHIVHGHDSDQNVL